MTWPPAVRMKMWVTFWRHPLSSVNRVLDDTCKYYHESTAFQYYSDVVGASTSYGFIQNCASYQEQHWLTARQTVSFSSTGWWHSCNHRWVVSTSAGQHAAPVSFANRIGKKHSTRWTLSMCGAKKWFTCHLLILNSLPSSRCVECRKCQWCSSLQRITQINLQPSAALWQEVWITVDQIYQGFVKVYIHEQSTWCC